MKQYSMLRMSLLENRATWPVGMWSSAHWAPFGKKRVPAQSFPTTPVDDMPVGRWWALKRGYGRVRIMPAPRRTTPAPCLPLVLVLCSLRLSPLCLPVCFSFGLLRGATTRRSRAEAARPHRLCAATPPGPGTRTRGMPTTPRNRGKSQTAATTERSPERRLPMRASTDAFFLACRPGRCTTQSAANAERLECGPALPWGPQSRARAVPTLCCGAWGSHVDQCVIGSM